jgi:hypothetical protein
MFQDDVKLSINAMWRGQKKTRDSQHRFIDPSVSRYGKVGVDLASFICSRRLEK